MFINYHAPTMSIYIDSAAIADCVEPGRFAVIIDSDHAFQQSASADLNEIIGAFALDNQRYLNGFPLSHSVIDAIRDAICESFGTTQEQDLKRFVSMLNVEERDIARVSRQQRVILRRTTELLNSLGQNYGVVPMAKLGHRRSITCIECGLVVGYAVKNGQIVEV